MEEYALEQVTRRCERSTSDAFAEMQHLTLDDVDELFFDEDFLLLASLSLLLLLDLLFEEELFDDFFLGLSSSSMMSSSASKSDVPPTGRGLPPSGTRPPATQKAQVHSYAYTEKGTRTTNCCYSLLFVRSCAWTLTCERGVAGVRK